MNIFIAMEFMKGGDLSDYIKNHELARAGAKTITTQVLEGLKVIHEEGMCHMDLKPKVIYHLIDAITSLTHGDSRTSLSPPPIQSGSNWQILAHQNVQKIHRSGQDVERKVILLQNCSACCLGNFGVQVINFRTR